ncbi:unnamed protein product [Paramecium pentaurelia]|uniref:Uncharacterized protein n=1 Tax=Paramecium pentaurelia TaxID=43138 RepID=A0A8S1VKY2_9CILI|nr:unnamed protein product [Paramecium pentaurelia]
MIQKKQIYRNFLCRDWRISNQICCLHLIFTLLSVIIFVASNYIYMYIVTEELMDITSEIFHKETQNHLNMLSYLEKSSTLDIFDDSTRQLLSINQLYKMIDKDFHIEMPYDCLNNKQYNDSYAYFFSFCYAFCNLTNGLNISKYENILKLTSLLTETLRIYDLQLLTLMAHVGEEQFFTQNRGYALSNYYPHTRQWYRDHIAQMGTGKQIIVSDPYVSWIDVVFISQTTNLSDTQFEGLIGQDIDFTRMPKIKSNTSQYYLVDKNGNIVISDLYANGVKVLIKMYNQSVTGFNETDWNNLIKKDENIFYLYNSVYEKNIIVLRTKLSELNYFLFVIYDQSQYLRQQQEIYNKQMEFQNQSIDFCLKLLGTFFIFSLLVQILIVNYLMKDLKRLEKMATKKVVYFYKSIAQFPEQRFTSSISRLYNAYMNLVNNFDSQGNIRKNELCSKIQSIEFPQKYRKLKCYIYSDEIPRKQNYTQTQLLEYFMYFKNETNF